MQFAQTDKSTRSFPSECESLQSKLKLFDRNSSLFRAVSPVHELVHIRVYSHTRRRAHVSAGGDACMCFSLSCARNCGH
eukprot:6204408-Pleurochrysis_carterae.AAC.1